MQDEAPQKQGRLVTAKPDPAAMSVTVPSRNHRQTYSSADPCKGFTLVELSIVLVIIGLLIGGILVAQSMIKTAKINAAVRDFTNYEIAVAAFKSKFNQLPGDSSLFPAINWFGHIGDNNGEIHHMESAVFWQHLSAGVGLKNTNGQDYIAETVSGFWVMGPKLNLDQQTADPFRLRAMGHDGYTAPNVWSYVNHNGGSGHAPFRPTDMASLDAKIDDGIPGSGSFLTHNGQAGGCLSGSGYNHANTNYVCSFTMVLGTINGLK